jgi:hypothetical protein
VDELVGVVEPAGFRPLVRAEFRRERRLDRGNASPGSIREDFNRLGLSIWASVLDANPRNRLRRARLEQLCTWRNAIAHQDFVRPLVPAILTLRVVREWRRSCDALARSLDRVASSYLATVIGRRPW